MHPRGNSPRFIVYMKIILEREKCVGCGSCAAVCGKFFEMGEDGKSRLKNSAYNAKKNEEALEIEKNGCAEEAAELCPVKCIRIIKN